MAHLGDLQKRLSKDADLQKDFINNPIKFLAKEGIELSPGMAKGLRAMCNQMKKSKRAVALNDYKIIIQATPGSGGKSK